MKWIFTIHFTKITAPVVFSSLYKETTYQILREEAKKNANVGAIDYTVIFAGKSALEILRMMVGGYFHMNQQEHMLNFYKVIYSERSIQPMAAKILAEETEKMIIATKQLFYAMEVHKLLHFQNADIRQDCFFPDSLFYILHFEGPVHNP